MQDDYVAEREARAKEAKELAALRKDAERYRKLRDAGMDERNRLEHYSGPALDVVLDALPMPGAAG